MKSQKTKGQKQNMPAVTKKYQQRATGDRRSKKEKNQNPVIYLSIRIHRGGVIELGLEGAKGFFFFIVVKVT